MSLGVEGKGFVVCGGSRGLGRAVADELVAEGARVLLVARSAEKLDQATSELGTNAFAFPCDLSRPEETDRLAATVPLTLGRLDGVFVKSGSVAGGEAIELDDGDWLAAFDVLIARPVRLVRRLAPLLGGDGAFLFASSTAREPSAGFAASNVLRPGAAAMVTCLARELAPAIRVNSLVPGRIDTDPARANDVQQAVAERQARQAFAEQQEAGAAPLLPSRLAAFLLSPAASNVTGATLSVDAGAGWETV